LQIEKERTASAMNYSL